MYLEQVLVGPMAIFAYILGCPETGEAVLIDPAWDEKLLVDRAEEQGFRVTTVINTHGHMDHTSGNQKVKELTGAKIIIGQGDAARLASSSSAGHQALGFTPSPPADETVVDGDIIPAGNLKLEVLATPGHSPGGICLYLPGHLFTGDTLFVGAVGRTDIAGASFEQLMASIRDKLLVLPGDTVVWPGHHYGPAPSSTLEEERRTNPFVIDLV